jgi:predicted site-specific integrase-resolvase
MDRLMTFKQVADHYAVTPRTVRNWADKGAIEVVRTPSGHPRVPSKSIDHTKQETSGNGGT